MKDKFLTKVKNLWATLQEPAEVTKLDYLGIMLGFAVIWLNLATLG